jgi:hypothetical protein
MSTDWRKSGVFGLLILSGCVTNNTEVTQLHAPFFLGSLRYILQDITLDTGGSLPGSDRLNLTLWVNNPTRQSQTFSPPALSIKIWCDYNRQVFQPESRQQAAAIVKPHQTIEFISRFDIPDVACDQGFNIELVYAGHHVSIPILRQNPFPLEAE